MREDKKLNKIVLTGGHAGTTALAVVEEIQSQQKLWEIHWIGPKKTFEGKGVASYHSAVFSKLGVFSHTIFSGRVQRKLSFWSFPSLLKIPFGFLHAFSLLMKIRPKVIVSFGGFAAFPVVVVGFFLGIPIIIHEQTTRVGRANKASSFFASKIAIARQTSQKFFPKKKTVLIGNPLMKSVLAVGPKQKMSSPPVVYVTGGSSGALFINKLLDSVLPQLLKKFKVIHQTGQLDYEHFLERKKTLEKPLSEKYTVINFTSPLEIGAIYEKADLMVSRAGANTVSEIIYTRKPSVLIPISWTAYNEQGENAKLAQEEGLAVVLPQDKATGETLVEKLDWLVSNWKGIPKKESTLAEMDKKAASKMVNLINEFLD